MLSGRDFHGRRSIGLVDVEWQKFADRASRAAVERREDMQPVPADASSHRDRQVGEQFFQLASAIFDRKPEILLYFGIIAIVASAAYGGYAMLKVVMYSEIDLAKALVAFALLIAGLGFVSLWRSSMKVRHRRC
jgi:predicted MFS family arabinose efflux permease